MSYYNQPDHELLDRRNGDARTLLLRLARGRLERIEQPVPRRPTEPPSIGSPGTDLASAWRAYARGRELPSPDSEPLVVDAQSVALVWRAHYVAALFAKSRRDCSKAFEQRLRGRGPRRERSIVARCHVSAREAAREVGVSTTATASTPPLATRWSPGSLVRARGREWIVLVRQRRRCAPRATGVGL